MSCEVHILAFEEEEILPFTLRHYATFAKKIVVHDAQSKDRTKAVSLYAGAIVDPWGLGGVVNDEEYCALKNSCWKETDADWVIVCDADELIYFPKGAEASLASYSSGGGAVIKPEGFEMFSEAYPTTTGQIYEEVFMGAPDNKWYSKPILFSPKMVEDSGLGMGSHDSWPVLKNGDFLHCNANWKHPDPPAYLLHYHQIGPIERIGARYDAVKERMSLSNRVHRRGNFKPGVVHAQEKRDFIMPRLRRVVG